MTDMSVTKLSSEQADNWAAVTDGIQVADRIDQGSAPSAEMTVGFARVAKGESLDISFPYDEVLVLTKGVYTVIPENGEPVTAHPGETIYLPAGSSNSSRAEEDAEMVYVAAPPAVYAEHVAAASETASERITNEVTTWPGVEAGPGDRGAFSFTLGRRELGHLHGDHALHIGFPKAVWHQLHAEGRIDYHPVFPGKPGYASRLLESEDDVADAIELLRLNYDRAVEKHGVPEPAGAREA